MQPAWRPSSYATCASSICRRPSDPAQCIAGPRPRPSKSVCISFQATWWCHYLQTVSTLHTLAAWLTQSLHSTSSQYAPQHKAINWWHWQAHTSRMVRYSAWELWMASMKLPVALKSTAAGIGVFACMALTAALWDSEMNHVGSSRNPALHRNLAPSCEIEDQAFHCRPWTLQRP